MAEYPTVNLPVHRCVMFLLALCSAGLVVFMSLTTVQTSFYRFKVQTSISRISKCGLAKISTKDLKYDKMQIPSAKYTKMEILNESRMFKLDDIIYVRITVYNALHKPINRGGDLILIWMTSSQSQASSTGSVTDHGNGSYTGHVRTLWTGGATIKCAIACSKEGFDLMYEYFENNGLSKRISCIFEAKRKREITIGSPFVPHNKPFCNLTAENYGIPWFCDKPKDSTIQCSDWTKVAHETMNTRPLRHKSCSISTYTRAIMHQLLPQTLNITVTEGNLKLLLPVAPCKGDNRVTWLSESPVGFFYNNTWYHNKCKAVPRTNFHQCFRNRRTILFGDSTVRQWFMYLFDKLELRFKTESWNGTKWHRQSVAYKPDYNSEIIWAHHGLPIYFGEINRGETRPIYVTLDQVPPGSNDTILIHLYAHLLYSHPGAFRRNVHRIVGSLKRLFIRSPKVKVAVKGPHYFSFRDRKTLGGMWGPIYDMILKDEFRDLYDKVLYIDTWDMTVARENRDVHPPSVLVRAMVGIFLDYICD